MERAKYQVVSEAFTEKTSKNAGSVTHIFVNALALVDAVLPDAIEGRMSSSRPNERGERSKGGETHNVE